MRLVTAFFLLCLVLSLSALAQNPSSSLAPIASPSAAPTTGPTTAYTLPPDKLEKAKALYDLDLRLLIVGTIYGLVILLALLYLGVVARYRDWAEQAAKYSFIQAMIVVPLLLLTMRILTLPLAAYRHSVSLRFGLSVQGWRS